MASNGYRGYRYKTGVEINATTDALLVGNVRTMHTHARTHARTHACKQSVDQPAILSLSFSLYMYIYIYFARFNTDRDFADKVFGSRYEKSRASSLFRSRANEIEIEIEIPSRPIYE